MFNMKNTSSQSICNTSIFSSRISDEIQRSCCVYTAYYVSKNLSISQSCFACLWHGTSSWISIWLKKTFSVGETFSCFICIQRNRFHLNLVKFSEPSLKAFQALANASEWSHFHLFLLLWEHPVFQAINNDSQLI